MKAVNLLPSELRSGPRRGRFTVTPAAPAPGGAGPFVVLGALALCVLAMAAYVLAANTVTERRSELARVTAEHEATARRAAALKPYGDFQEMALRRTRTVSSLAALRFDWEQALRDVSHALPGTVTLTSLDGSISTDTGSSSSQLRGAIPSPAITLKGCTRTQSAVATTLSRLRGVRGTTRVTLSKSERVENSASGNAQAAPCGEGTRPQFEVVVFFERSSAGAGALSAAAEPLPAAGTATASATPGAAETPTAGTQPASATPTPTPTPAP
jgi:Tfp pilus assembly protein PilN